MGYFSDLAAELNEQDDGAWMLYECEMYHMEYIEKHILGVMFTDEELEDVAA